MDQRPLQHLPVTLFAAVMGVGGLALAWRRAAKVWGVSEAPFQVLLWTALILFVVIGVAYLAKWVRHPAAARAELRHPIRVAFVPTITISFLVLATALSEVAPEIARVLWWIGGVGHLIATVAVLSAWFGRPEVGMTQVTPAWFIPIVGNVITPLAAPKIGNLDLAWFAFGVGVIFWLALLPLVLQRLLLHDPGLPDKLLPTLAIFIAPPSVVALSWQALTGELADPVGRIAYAATLMFTLLVLAQVPRLIRVPFGFPFLAYTFPLAVAASVAIAMAGAAPGVGYDVIAVALLALATFVITAVIVRVGVATARGQLLVPEG